MKTDKTVKHPPDQERISALRSLPPYIKETLTKEETDAFLYEEVWPDSLFDKLKDFIVEED
jgi:hypothetical protein